MKDQIIYSIIEDNNGNLWVGTDNAGICKIDLNKIFHNETKYAFKHYTIYEGLLGHKISKIILDNNGWIWVATNHGVNIFYPDSSFFSHPRFLSFTQKNGLNDKWIQSLLEDKDGNIWVGTYSGGLNKVDFSNRYKSGKYFYSYTVKDGLPSNRIWSIYQDSTQTIWLGTENGLTYFNPDLFDSNHKYRFTTINEKNGLPNNKVRTIIEDKSGNLWLGTFNGVCHFPVYKKDNFNKHVFRNFTSKNGLSNNSVWALFEDNEQNIWIGTFGGGANKFSGYQFAYFTKEEGLPSNQITSVYYDRSENLWVGTDGDGIAKICSLNIKNPNANIDIFSTKNGLSGDMIYTINEDTSKNILIGTYGNGVTILPINKFTKGSILRPFYLNESNGLPSNKITNILTTHLGQSWVGSFGGLTKLEGFFSSQSNNKCINFGRANGLITPIVYSVFEDNQQKLWVCTKHGLGEFIESDVILKSSRNFRMYITNRGSINDRVTCMTQDKTNLYWIGTDGNGLVMANKKNDTLVFIDQINYQNGLSDNVINSLLLDDQEKQLYIGTNKGIDVFNMQEFHRTKNKIITHYGIEDGFLGSGCVLNALTKNNEGLLFVGTMQGLVIFSPKEIRFNPIPPKTHITSIKLFLKNTNLKKYSSTFDKINFLPNNLTLPYNENHITFDFIGINLTVPQKVRYRFMLKGYDKSWSPKTNETHATYTNLGPGKYSFMVKSCNNNNLWNNEPTRFNFTIAPPYWETLWFYLSEFLFFVVLLVLSFFVGRKNSKTKIKTILIFTTLFLVFEYIKVSFEPYFEKFLGGIPLFKVIINLIIVLIFIPVEKIVKNFLEGIRKNPPPTPT